MGNETFYWDGLRGMHDKPSLFGSRYLGRNGCQADYEKLKKDYFLKYQAVGIMSWVL